MAVAPFFRAKVAPCFRAKDNPQTGTVKFFDKALCKSAGMEDTALRAYLHRKATAWYKQFPLIYSQNRAKDPGPKTPQVDGGNGAGGSPEDEEDVAERPVVSESSLASDEADDEGRQ